jgi:hypothetical protein
VLPADAYWISVSAKGYSNSSASLPVGQTKPRYFQPLF